MSGFDWSDSAEGGAQSESIPNVTNHPVTVHRVVYGKKNGQPFRSKAGDPQIMVILRDAEEREAAAMFTLSKKAAWTLARLLSRFGVDLDALTGAGIEPHHFADQAIADAYLIGKRGRINVEWPIVNGEVSKYPNIEPCEATGVPAVPTFGADATPKRAPTAAPAQAVEIQESDIPFDSAPIGNR